MKEAFRVIAVASILASVLVAAEKLWAQAPIPAPFVPAPTPFVVSGSDIGFRIEGRRGETPVGRFVVRINGQWVEANAGGEMKRLSQ